MTTPRSLAWVAVRVGVAVGMLAFTLTRAPLPEVAEALARLDAGRFAFAVAVLFATNFLGTVRWRWLLSAFGATELPPFPELLRLYLTGTFFNTFLPGGLGGDVLRAAATQRALGRPAAAWASVFVERVLGLAALLTWAGVVLRVTPLEGVRSGYVLVAGGILVAGALLGAATLDHGGQSRPPRLLPFVGSYAISMLGHCLMALAGHVLVIAVVPGTRLTDSLLVVPLAQAAAYFPATVAGIGVREAAFVDLYHRLGVATADATAAAFGFLGASLGAAAACGVALVSSEDPRSGRVGPPC